MDDNQLQRAVAALQAALNKQPGLTTEDAIVEVYLAARSATRLLNTAYLRLNR